MFAQRVQANDEQTALTYHRAAFTHYSMGFPLAAGVSLDGTTPVLRWRSRW